MRGLAFRFAAVLVGLSPFILAEVLFTILDLGGPGYSDDPFVGFRAVHPLFVLNEQSGQYETATSRLPYFRPDSFAKEKGAGEFRIFCLGGSTVQGRPFAVETSFTTWLGIALEAAEPSRDWKVVNCGGVSYASYRLVPILEEVLDYQPDLIILYTGHNEFLEDRSYRHIKHLPAVVAWPCELVARTRTFSLVAQASRHLPAQSQQTPPAGRPLLEAEVDAMLEYQGGLEQYHRDEKWRRDTVDHFRYNIRRMVEMAREAGVAMLLVNPVSNLRDCPPFKTQHRDGLTPEELDTWLALVNQAKECQGTDLCQAIASLEEAVRIDGQHAGLHYLLAKCYDALGMFAKAKAEYIQAKELDICPLRVLEPMNEAILEIGRRTGTPVVDVRKMYDELSDAGIPGSYLLVDHVHPSIAGHQLVATALANELGSQGLIDPVPNWTTIRDERFRRHLESLSDLYFAKGQQRLEMLKCWTQGKATRQRRKPPLPATPENP